MQITDTRKKLSTAAVPTQAANQDFVTATAAPRQSIATTAGWDPYEVWQRMIKQPRERRSTEPA